MGHRKCGEIWINQRGEFCIKTEKGNKAYHRYLVEQYIGYKLLPTLTIHHIDGNHQNNNLKNLMIVSERLHSLIHQYGLTDMFVSNLSLYKNRKDIVYDREENVFI